MEEETEKVGPIRTWFRKRAKMITLYGGAAAAILTVVVSWVQLDAPVPATTNDVQTVQQYAEGTRKIVLNQEWFRVSTQLKAAQAKLKADPHNVTLIRKVTKLELALREVEDQLSKVR